MFLNDSLVKSVSNFSFFLLKIQNNKSYSKRQILKDETEWPTQLKSIKEKSVEVKKEK